MENVCTSNRWMPGRLSRRLRSRLLPLHRISRCNQRRLVRFPSLPCMRCPTESNIQMDGSLAQDLGLCPSDGRRMHYNLSNCSHSSNHSHSSNRSHPDCGCSAGCVYFTDCGYPADCGCSTGCVYSTVAITLITTSTPEAVLHRPVLLPMPRIQQNT